MTTPDNQTEAAAVPAGWRYSINYGPDGETNYAMVYASNGEFVGNLRTHHAIAICNAFAACEKAAASPPPPVAAGGLDGFGTRRIKTPGPKRDFPVAAGSGSGVEPISDERLAGVRERFDAIEKAEPDSLTGHVKGLLARLDMAERRATPAPRADAGGTPSGARVEAVLDQDRVSTWPPLKHALWMVVTGEKLNDGHYINAYHLTDKLYDAALASLSPAATPELAATGPDHSGYPEGWHARMVEEAAATQGSEDGGLIDAPAIPKLDNGAAPTWGDSGPVPGQHFGDEFTPSPAGGAVREAWNSIADEHNQWSALSLDERADLTRFAAALTAGAAGTKVEG